MWKRSLCMQSDNKHTLNYCYVRLKETKQGRTTRNLPATANYVSLVICCFTDKFSVLGFFPVREELFKHVIVQYRESCIEVNSCFFCIKFSFDVPW